MKIQCNACEAAEASVLCCADDAALCWACDEKVHAANKLASKHQRVPLSNSSSQMPKCDICQETVGYFFCLEDRALLCRKCDVAIHTANNYVSGHQRFLLTGVKVGLESEEPVASSTKEKLNPAGRDVGVVSRNPGTECRPEPMSAGVVPRNERIISRLEPSSAGMVSRNIGTISRPEPRRHISPQMAGENSGSLSSLVCGVGSLPTSTMSFSGGPMSGSSPQWPLDEFFGFTELSQNYGFMDHTSSKADSGRQEDSDWSPILRAADEELDVDECLGQVPEMSWMVPQMPSPPTASGLNWPKNLRNPPSDCAASVPDICSLRAGEVLGKSSAV
uniref:B box-type domain-containing protein n=1 Tax=Nelumbo nucifera TaxID=4432 RepID=A0A822ZSD1_NELNU|nr:TPA_asm: hypothetical protein HUJ06_018089 [Nelumbo nucifera]